MLLPPSGDPFIRFTVSDGCFSELIQESECQIRCSLKSFAIKHENLSNIFAKFVLVTETIQVSTKLPKEFVSIGVEVLEILDLYVDLVHMCVVCLTVSMTCFCLF